MKIIKTYIGAKIVQAEEMDERTFISLGQQKQETIKGLKGYRVIYPDGYIGWCPKDVFEEVYREISLREEILIKNK